MGWWGGGAGVIFFTMNPNLKTKKFFFGWGGEGEGAGISGLGLELVKKIFFYF